MIMSNELGGVGKEAVMSCLNVLSWRAKGCYKNPESGLPLSQLTERMTHVIMLKP